MRRLILVRHSIPEIRRDVPARDWRLSDAGVARARALAGVLDPGDAQRVFTSTEPKAVDTAAALADAWGIPVDPVAGLQEHERPTAQMLSREEFDARVRELFARPADLVFGAETAEQARRRFTMAVMRLLAGTAHDVVLVSHGTVMTLFVAGATGLEPFAFWRRLGMPCATTLEIPEMRLVKITNPS